MNQNQCVPSWELDDVGKIHPPPTSRLITSRSHSTSLSAGPDTSTVDYEVAELTWENGQLTMHGLGLPRVSSKSNLAGAWAEKVTPTRASGTLESIVNQATKKSHPLLAIGGACDLDDDLVPWLNPNGGSHHHRASAPNSVSMTMDALVPTTASAANRERQQGGGGGGGAVGCSTRVGSCSAVGRVPMGSDWSVSASEQLENGGGMTSNNGVTSTSLGTSPENTKTTTVDDHDSVCHSTPQKERDAEEERQKKGTTKSSLSVKRSRAAAIHNQSERKRRDKINQRMKTLQKLVPNSNKTDKASMLDEVIDYLKQLQAQVQMMSRMSLPSMMMPMAMQQLQMSMMSQMGMAGMGMGMGMAGMPGMAMHGMDHVNMGMNSMPRQTIPGIPNPAAFMPPLATPWDGGDRLSSHQQQAIVPADLMSSYLACQSQPATMDAYNRMVAMYQQLHHQQRSAPGSNT